MQNNFSRIGTAGWNLPSTLHDLFPAGKSLLERYSQVFNAVEINTSFYKPHKKTSYERWALATPTDFEFSVKMYKLITHEKKLVATEAELGKFIDEVSGLQSKLGPILIQLPPSLNFNPEITNRFFSVLRDKFSGKVALEPRHISWAHLDALTLLQAYKIEWVSADPVRVATEFDPLQDFSYFRLHGSPIIYSSSYDAIFLDQLAKRINNSSWVIFDNTQFGAGIQNALDLKQLKKQ